MRTDLAGLRLSKMKWEISVRVNGAIRRWMDCWEIDVERPSSDPTFEEIVEFFKTKTDAELLGESPNFGRRSLMELRETFGDAPMLEDRKKQWRHQVATGNTEMSFQQWDQKRFSEREDHE